MGKVVAPSMWSATARTLHYDELGQGRRRSNSVSAVAGSPGFAVAAAVVGPIGPAQAKPPGPASFRRRRGRLGVFPGAGWTDAGLHGDLVEVLCPTGAGALQTASRSPVPASLASLLGSPPIGLLCLRRHPVMSPSLPQ